MRNITENDAYIGRRWFQIEILFMTNNHTCVKWFQIEILFMTNIEPKMAPISDIHDDFIQKYYLWPINIHACSVFNRTTILQIKIVTTDNNTCKQRLLDINSYNRKSSAYWTSTLKKRDSNDQDIIHAWKEGFTFGASDARFWGGAKGCTKVWG